MKIELLNVFFFSSTNATNFNFNFLMWNFNWDFNGFGMERIDFVRFNLDKFRNWKSWTCWVVEKLELLHTIWMENLWKTVEIKENSTRLGEKVENLKISP